MKRFGINDSTFFNPPRPGAWVNAPGLGAVTAASFPSFGEFFGAYFQGKSFNTTDPKCAVMVEGMKKCYENNSKDPINQCQYYISGFERMSCGN